MSQNQSIPKLHAAALWFAFFLSGTAALGYQILWAKMFALGLGHEFPAVVAVIAAFFGGMAVGAAWSRRLLNRFGAKSFALLEVVIGVWGLLTPFLIGAANNYILSFQSPWAPGILITFLTLLPATAAMGASLPAMSALSRNISGAYAANTFGAVAGCLLAAFWLMPTFGLKTSCALLALLNILAAALSFRRQAYSRPEPRESPHYLLFVTGFVALAFETIGVRLLSQSLENTVFTFATILAVYLFGQAAGAALFHRWRKIASFLALGISIAVSLWAFRFSGAIYDTLRARLGDSPSAVFASELLTTSILYLIPTLFMGAVFARLAEKAGERSLGPALVWNSLGAGLAAIAIPLLGIPNFAALTKIPAGSVLRETRSGRMATVTVTETPDGNRTLFVNNRFQMGGTAAAIPELRHGHIPLLLHPNPQRALFLGLGTGISFSAASVYPNLQADGVELLPEVIEVMPEFFQGRKDWPFSAHTAIHVADARRYIAQSRINYDVIVADLFHPAQDGAGFLYTRDHFARVQQRLAPDGLFCQWLPLHQLDLATFRSITRTFLDVFPNAEMWLLRFNIDAPVAGLIGWKNPRPPFAANTVERRLTFPALAEHLRRVALADSLRLYGCFLAGPDRLQAFAGAGTLNTDAFPIVLFEAPAFSYRRAAPTYERLVAFLDAIGTPPPPAIADPTLTAKVERFLRARDVYLRALVLEAQNKTGSALDGYIESARLSEDFTSGYAQCLAIATAHSKTDPASARRILERLVEAQPNRPVAREMLERLAR